ncbi:MAG: hypothetical protein ABIN96_08590 [Rubrivivax sp.]
MARVKAWQHCRFRETYSDLLAQPRYEAAAQFFLDDLYGPGDFSQRDDQFARVVPALVRLFPREIIGTVEQLAELHALSEALDTAMARAVEASQAPAVGDLDSRTYAQAWRSVGRPADRERQIDLMLEVGGALERFTRKPLLRQSLRFMRGPAQAAGLGALQAFLERGFDTFRGMQSASAFLDTIATREKKLAQQLFGGGSASS